MSTLDVPSFGAPLNQTSFDACESLGFKSARRLLAAAADVPANLTGKRLHFIGIGGIGMSAMARIALSRGAIVSGSDLVESDLTRALVERGATVFVGDHAASNVAGVEVVIISSAIDPANPELVAARAAGAEVIQRSPFLARLFAGSNTIGVTGAHGKTTTTWMISNLLIDAEKDPTVLVGGTVKKLGNSNFRVGKGAFFPSEIDESDGMLTSIHPYIAVVTNIDKEHMDTFGTMERLEHAILTYMKNTRPDGLIVGCGDDERVLRLMRESGRRFVTYGHNEGNDLRVDRVRSHGMSMSFKVQCPAQPELYDGLRFKLPMPGEHNVLNACAALCIGRELGIDPAVALESLGNCERVHRRFEIIGEKNNIRVVDDYGHHPTEIKATLKAAKASTKGRLVVAFQPHRYSRTRSLIAEFQHAFRDADALIVTEIYGAGERPIPGVSGEMMVDAITKAGYGLVYFAPDQDSLLELLAKITRSGDTILTLGAGDITDIGPSFLSRMAA
ncbi:MAG TPA: UDP-N-acetylmuramate--L-alanine ligase [Planctomycetota bacterium]|nr:UDP-N-acetylmuramate--L-alanine ligase [Planctomycetota bacterium]